MLTINMKNVELVRQICGIEMACRAITNIILDLPHTLILELVQSGEISRETALASAPTMTVDELGPIENLSLLERFASLSNPNYAQLWYDRRAEWGKLLYSTPESPEVLSRILPHLSQEAIGRLDFSSARYLAAKVPYLDLVAQSTVDDEEEIPEPTLSVSDPTLSMWRHLLTKPLLTKLFERTQWSIFNYRSNSCIYVDVTEEETRLMLLSNTKPLPVVIARGKWTKDNITDIYRKIEMSADAESMMLILYERVCRLWGTKSELAEEVKSKLRYTKILTPSNLLKYYTVEWYPSVPAIHHYINEASDLELERLIDANYRANIGIYDVVGVSTPSALRRICIAALRWMLTHQRDQAQSIRNILNVIAHYTNRVSWDKESAMVCQDALSYTYTKELKLQFILMATYPSDYKDELIKDD